MYNYIYRFHVRVKIPYCKLQDLINMVSAE